MLLLLLQIKPRFDILNIKENKLVKQFYDCRNYTNYVTQKCKILIFWEVTYWKTLIMGYQVRYQKQTIEINKAKQSFALRQREKKQINCLKKWETNYFKECSE